MFLLKKILEQFTVIGYMSNTKCGLRTKPTCIRCRNKYQDRIDLLSCFIYCLTLIFSPMNNIVCRWVGIDEFTLYTYNDHLQRWKKGYLILYVTDISNWQ